MQQGGRMSDFDSDVDDKQQPEVRELKAAHRRVLGVLLEKAFTTPEYYPLTLKAVTAGCNQKSNRSPTVSYDEDFVEEKLDELKELGLVGVLHPDSGRSLRYRHYMRKRYTFTEPQLAILTELFLRGRQTMGELRGRAGRMVEIDDLATLRAELSGLISKGHAQASGSLERRGIEVDHAFYLSTENRSLSIHAESDERPANPSPTTPANVTSRDDTAPAKPDPAINKIRSEISELRAENLELRSEVESLKSMIEELETRIDGLCRDLGV